MSYNRMDHAEWVASNNRALNSINARRKSYRAAPEDLSEFQAKAMDILGMVCGGIYNAPINWEKVDWNYGWGGLSVILGDRCMATYDFDQLTKLVFLCHEARIRGQLDAHTRGYYRVSFWQRPAEGGINTRHPNLDEAVASFREYLPDSHRIIYRAPTPHVDRMAA